MRLPPKPASVWIVIAALSASAVACRGVSAQVPSVRVIALSNTDGPSGPGLGQGVAFTHFYAPWINRSGRLVFKSNVDGTGVISSLNDQGWWTVREDNPGVGGSLQMLIRKGDPVPGLPGYTFNAVGFQLGAGAAMLLVGQVTSSSGASLGAAWLGTPNGWRLLLRSDDSRLLVPPAPTYGSMSVAFSPSGLLLGTSQYGSIRGLWTLSPVSGEVRMLASYGAPVPGSPGSSEVLQPYSASLDRWGNALIWSGVLQNTLTVRAGIYEQVGSNALVERQSGLARCNGGFTNASVGADGSIAVSRSFYDESCVQSSADVLVGHLGDPGALQTVWQTGDPAPGIPGGAVWSGITRVDRRGNGPIILTATVVGPNVIQGVNDLGVWIGSPALLRLAWQGGGPVSGLPAGVAMVQSTEFYGVPNARGQIVIQAALSGPGVTSDNNRALVGFDPALGLSLLARRGEPLPAGDGFSRTVLGFLMLSSTTESDGQSSGLNDLGEVAFAASFTDGSEGVFVGSVPSVGACCLGASCSVAPVSSCTGAYQGSGTSCGTIANPLACCRANFNGVGGIEVQDVFDFIAAWFAADSAADFNADGRLGTQDIFDFLAAWFAGC